MTTFEDLENRVEALEMDLPTRRGIVTHLHNLDQKFQRLEEGQQRHEQQIRELHLKVDEGFLRLDQKIDVGLGRLDEKLDLLLAQSKVNLD